ncbi:Hydrolase-4 domain-containing protein [Mycena chlorophos]|uniref:Hydrolase-4 domain-containing protein n=1 Tax=Mycena chlorophos TaxID=658473 RepID=A0A8H6SW56_MYCCL|nr:Hydrolase-4 domain-containing protein [Mycena chlorophos]
MPIVRHALFATSADGTRIYAEAVGLRSDENSNAKRPILLFVHGFSMTNVAFDAIFNDERWTDWGYLIRYDLRGHGRSGKPVDPEAWTSKRFAEDVDAVFKAFGVQEEKPFVVGWSLGATIITDILAVHPPSYLSGIVYAAPLPYMGPTLSLVGTPECLGLLPALLQDADVKAYQEAARGFVGRCWSGFQRVIGVGMDADSEVQDPTVDGDDADYHAALTILGTSLLQPRAVTTQLLLRTQDPAPFLASGAQGGLPMLALFGTEDRIIQKGAALNAIASWAAERIQVRDLEGADHFLWLPARGKSKTKDNLRDIWTGGKFGEMVREWVDGVRANAST